MTFHVSILCLDYPDRKDTLRISESRPNAHSVKCRGNKKIYRGNLKFDCVFSFFSALAGIAWNILSLQLRHRSEHSNRLLDPARDQGSRIGGHTALFSPEEGPRVLCDCQQLIPRSHERHHSAARQ